MDGWSVTNVARWRLLVVLLLLTGVPAWAGPRRGPPPGMLFDPSQLPPPPWRQPYIVPWGPGVYQDYGYWAPVGGSWDNLLKSGPTVGVGAIWKYADWSGDLLPPSSTLLKLDYRYTRLKGDHDTQFYSPGGFVGEVDEMRLHLLEFGATQRFGVALGGHAFVDAGAVFGVGGADSHLSPVLPDPTKDALFVSARREDGVVLRGAVNAGFGMQLGWFDIRFLMEAGLSGSNALGNGLRSQGDFGLRMSGTIYLFDE